MDEPEAEPKEEPEGEPKNEPEAEPMDEPEAEPKEEPKAEPEPEAEAEPEPEPEPDPEAGRSFICRVWALLRVAARNVLVSVSMRDLPLRALSVWASVCMS